MKIGLVLLMMLVAQAFGRELKWDKVELGGVEYVPVVQLAQFYRFEEPVIKGTEVILKNKIVTMVFESGSKRAAFNEVGFLLGQNLLKKDDDYLISANDLTLVIDPVLRPARVKGLGKFTTVLFRLRFPEGFAEKPLFEAAFRKRVKMAGFKVVVLESEAELVKFQENLGAGNAVYLEVDFLQGEERVMKTHSLGPLSKPSLALATGIHWVTLKEVKRSGLGEVEDGRIALGQGDRLKKLDFPACHLELTMDFSGKTLDKVKLARLSHVMAKSLGQGLIFTRKAAQQNQAKADKDAAAE